MQSAMYKWEIAIAGLIHDIGKLYQKSDSKEVGGMRVRKNSDEHPLMASDFIDKHYKIFSNVKGLEVEVIRLCAQHHHSGSWGTNEIKVSGAPSEYRKYCQIINIADNLSSSERTIDEEYSHKELATLVPFFTRLKSEITPRQYAFKLQKYSDNAFRIIKVPDEVHNREAMDKFIADFEKEVDNIEARTKQELFNQLNRVIRDYTWCMPAAVRESIRDVSLYQHLITTSAIATAIYSDLLACSSDEKFTMASVGTKDNNIKLVHLKLDNVENYILKTSTNGFNVLDEISKRKLYVSNEYSCIIRDILDGLDLTPANSVISSEFETYILVCEQSIEKFLRILQDRSECLKETFGADVYLAYSIQDLSFGAIESGNKKLKHMTPVLSNAPEYMHNALEDSLKIGGKWKLDSFTLPLSFYLDSSKYMDIELPESFETFKKSIRNFGNKIAFICIDGDKTIETMEKCFQSATVDDGTISRVSTYTNILGAFFNNYLRDNFPDEYTININSNRLIMVSSIENIMGKVSDIRQMFKEYTLDTMTLSITVHTYNINEKIVDVIGKCNSSMVNLKKKGGNFVVYKKLYLRDADIERYIHISSLVYESCSNTSALRRLTTYSYMYKEYVESKDVLKLMCIPLYDRNKNNDTKELNQELIDIIDNAFNKVFSNEKVLSKELFLLGNIIEDVLIERRLN